MLQDLYDDGFVFAGLLWVRFGGFLFREETGLMGLGFGIVSFVDDVRYKRQLSP